MTWQGGKLRREQGAHPPFARLRKFASTQDDAASSLDRLSKALSGLGTPVRMHIQLIRGTAGETVEHWEVYGGATSATAKKATPKDPDFVVVMRPETLAQIAGGELAPYEALYAGRLRIGGDFERAKAVVKHLTDPAAPYIAPC